jgi:hypothetical protein
MVPFLAAAGGAVVGSVLGFLGALYLQRRRDRDEARGQILSIALEMGRQEDTIRHGIEQGQQLSDEMRRDIWDRYNTTLTNWLPWHVTGALHAHHQRFDTVKEVYKVLTTSYTEKGPKLDAMHSELWAFFHRSCILRERVQDSVERFYKPIWPGMPRDAKPSERENQKLKELFDQWNREGLEFLKSKGIAPPLVIPTGVTTI